jgi:YD repeat-containing protein
MKRLSNRLIPEQWKLGKPAQNHNKSYHTDGNNLYSYNLLIGTTTPTGTKIAYDYTSKSNNFISQTTTQHVSFAKPNADYFLDPQDALQN